MLLRDNFQILIDLNLSQVPFSLARTALQTCEKLGRQEEQLFFLKQCKGNDVLPKTITNLKLPSCFHSSYMRSARLKIQLQTLNSMIRFTYGEISRSKKRWSRLEMEFHEQFTAAISEANSLSAAMVHAYHIGRVSHHSILRQRFHKLLDAKLSTESRFSRREINNDDIRDTLVTDKTNSLDADELALLAKGPKFALAPPVNQNTIIDFNVQFCRFAHQFRWKHYLHNEGGEKNEENGNSVTLSKYPWDTRLKMPVRDNEIEDKLKRLYFQVKDILLKEPCRPKFSNLTDEERNTLDRLKQKELTYLPSDKGGEFCVIKTTDYNTAGVVHLSDVSTYRKISHLTPATVEKRINSTWKIIARQRNIPKYVTRSYVTTNSQHPKFYHLIKTHKAGADLKIRPIVSNCNGPTKRISWLMTKLLSPLLARVPAHLGNSKELMDSISTINNDSRQLIPCSFDVVSLYTSIPIQDAIRNIKEKLEQYEITMLNVFHHGDICSLLESILTNTFFVFEDQIYQQICGLPMGSSVSGILAILFLDTIEQQALRSFGHIPIFKRYVDDCFTMVSSMEEANSLLQLLNQQHPNIRFEIETPADGHSLSLLDFTIIVSTSGETHFEFYKKNARKNIFVHYRSHLPMQSKMAIVRNERARMQDRCSNPITLHKHEREFDRMLNRHQYPAVFIQNSKCVKRRSSNRTPEDYIYLKLPFISELADRRIRQVFRREEINLRIAHKSKTLRNYLQPKKEAPQCTLRNCPLNNSMCNRKNTVYQLQCPICSSTYIGSSIRPLHCRVKEHLTCPGSSVYRHVQRCGINTVKAKILAIDMDNANLRLREAIFIQNLCPSMNSRDESDELKDFIFL